VLTVYIDMIERQTSNAMIKMYWLECRDVCLTPWVNKKIQISMLNVEECDMRLER